MTAKEELLELVDSLSEDEARDALHRLRPRPDAERLAAEAKEQARRLAVFFDSSRGKGLMSEEEWTEFARDFDAQRPHRPVFSEWH